MNIHGWTDYVVIYEAPNAEGTVTEWNFKVNALGMHMAMEKALKLLPSSATKVIISEKVD